jgi:exodeoxyribonuclease V alpha subunit
VSLEIRVTLQKIIFESEDRSYIVAEFIDTKSARRLRASGNLGLVGKSDLHQDYRLFGDWQNHTRYGQTFGVVYCEPIRPDTLSGIIPFLANNVRGVGEKTARKLLDELAVRNIDDFVEICRTQRERVLAFFKNKRAVAESVLALITGNEVYRGIMVFLHEHNIPPNFAQKIYDRYGADALTLLNENPYRLIRDFRNVGFVRADAIAQKLGMDPTSPFRLEAAFVYALEMAQDDGHCCLPRDELVRQCCDILGGKHDPRFSFDFVLAQLRQVYKRCKDQGEPPFLLRSVPAQSTRSQGANPSQREMFFYLPDMFYLENTVARHCLDLIALDGLGVEARELRLLEDPASLTVLLPGIPWEKLSDEQRDAVRTSISARVMVLTGGPGCGKTFVLRAIHAVQGFLKRKVALCAPTGLAAKRMTAAIGAPASTIHKLLGLGRGDTPEEGGEGALDNVDCVIVDEASMLGIDLFRLLLQAIGPNRRLFLVGDVDQLPSVNAGNCLRDIIHSETVKVARLTRIFRQASESPIPIAARQILGGEKPELLYKYSPEQYSALEPLSMLPCNGVQFAELLVEMVRDVLPRYGLHPTRDIQILVPMRRSDVGQERVNQVLQRELNPPAANKKEYTLPNGVMLREGDKVIQTRNNYDKDVFNGDLGYCREIRGGKNSLEVVVQFDEKMVKLEDDEVEDLQLCYAMTVHKSQGSEFPLCILPMFGAYHVMLDKNLLYTAVTRASRSVLFMGEEWALRRAVRTESAIKRHTNLEILLREKASCELVTPA